MYLDNKELVKQFFFIQTLLHLHITLYLSVGYLLCKVIFEIENRKIYLKAKINDFEKGEHIETLSEIGFEDLDDFSINKTKIRMFTTLQWPRKNTK